MESIACACEEKQMPAIKTTATAKIFRNLFMGHLTYGLKFLNFQDYSVMYLNHNNIDDLLC